MRTIITALTGSRAHGLHNEKSDYDWRGVFTVPLLDHVSPFKKVQNNHWVEGEEDNTSYEMTNFIKGCCHCNPNYLEVVYAPEFKQVEGLGHLIIDNADKFLDAQRIFDAHRGYAHNQYNKMDLFEPNDKTPKFAVAYIRSLHNGAELLREGMMNIQIQDPVLKDNLRAIKYDFINHKELAMGMFESKQKEIIEAKENTKVQEHADIDFWQELILKHYQQ